MCLTVSLGARRSHEPPDLSTALVPDSAAVVQVFAMATGGGAAPAHVGDVEEDASQLLFPKGAQLSPTWGGSCSWDNHGDEH